MNAPISTSNSGLFLMYHVTRAGHRLVNWSWMVQSLSLKMEWKLRVTWNAPMATVQARPRNLFMISQRIKCVQSVMTVVMMAMTVVTMAMMEIMTSFALPLYVCCAISLDDTQHFISMPAVSVCQTRLNVMISPLSTIRLFL